MIHNCRRAIDAVGYWLPIIIWCLFGLASLIFHVMVGCWTMAAVSCMITIVFVVFVFRLLFFCCMAALLFMGLQFICNAPLFYFGNIIFGINAFRHTYVLPLVSFATYVAPIIFFQSVIFPIVIFSLFPNSVFASDSYYLGS